jgi:hypothetical protein
VDSVPDPDPDDTAITHALFGAKLSDAAAAWFQRSGLRPWTIEEAGMARLGEEVPLVFDRDAEEASRICIWCGKICESIPDLEEHEEECGA